MQELAPNQHGMENSEVNPCVAFEHKTLPPSLPQDHHHIAVDVCHKLDLLRWIGKNKTDPALMVSVIFPSLYHYQYSFQDFLPCLKDHLLPHLLGYEWQGDEIPFTPAQQNMIMFANNWIYTKYSTSTI